MSKASNQAVADVFFALGDRTRLSLVRRLGARPLTATTLSDGARVTRQAIVKHLQVLEGAGLVKHEKRGREVLYLLKPDRFEEARMYLEMISASWDQAIDRLRLLVEETRPARHKAKTQLKPLHHRRTAMTRKESATAFLTMVANRAIREAYEKFISPGFIHHNQYFRGDRQTLMAAMEQAGEKNPNKTLEIKKVFEDGDTVVTLSHVKQNPDDSGAAVVHILRFEGNQVVELWDFGQPIVKDSPNENGVF